MNKVFTKESRERAMFGEFWELCQRYWIPEESPEYWKALTKDVDKFYEKYKDLHSIVMDLAASLVGGMDEQMRKGIKK